ncbi:hypothetical protein [Actinomadura sp. 7K507]|uniref:hypothetical protein n=1 Tax=Actinomadura sp. 7K507 TaxID=2530365 RepID=UPI001046FC77|nr:hypothetical protein [Actinomadura sp. 7K507]TDC85592.1 hypothetical protein E1285_24885 [Actinomadura sp. 7K507]
MASVEISEQMVRSQAGEETFELGRSLADRGQVGAVTADGTRVGASVGDVAVNLRITTAGVGADCARTDCAGEVAELCEHAVAVALTWLRSGIERPGQDLLTVLRSKDPGWLAARLTDLAADDPVLTARLLAEAGGPDAPAVHTLREDLEGVVAEMTAERDDGHYDVFDEWYPDTEELEEVLDDIEDLLDRAPDAVADLAEHAVRLLGEAIGDGCHGHELPDVLARAADLHLDACRAGAPDPVALAERLLTGALNSGWGTFADLSE